MLASQRCLAVGAHLVLFLVFVLPANPPTSSSNRGLNKSVPSESWTAGTPVVVHRNSHWADNAVLNRCGGGGARGYKRGYGSGGGGGSSGGGGAAAAGATGRPKGPVPTLLARRAKEENILVVL